MMAFIMPISSSSIVGSRIHNVDGVTTSLRITTNAANDHEYDEDNCNNVKIETTEEQLYSVITSSSRRRLLLTTAPASVVTSSLSAFAATMISSTIAYADEGVPTSADSSRGGSMYSPKFVQSYDDFITTSDGWSYKDVKIGSIATAGDTLKDGDRVVFDWSGYTIGYFGRPFEAKGGPQGGAFDKDIDYFRTVLGSKTIISGLDSALRTMTLGGVRQVIIPYGPLSYPSEDASHDKVGPKPTTFSGMRALNFVLENPRVDRTLLFNVKLIRVDKSDGKGGFVRGG